MRGFALSLTLSHGRGDWVVNFPPLPLYSKTIFVKRAGCFLGFQVAFKWCFRGSVSNGVYFAAASVFRSHSLNVQAAFVVSGSLHFGFWGAGCFQVALNACRGFRRTGRAWLGFGFV